MAADSSQKKSVVPVKAEREKKLKGEKVEKPKTGEKRTFDLASLNEMHCQDMADSARHQDNRLSLEVKRAELQLEHECNKRRKMELDQERLRREEERDKCFFSFMQGMMSGGMGGAMRGSGMGSGGMGGGYGMQASTSSSVSPSSSMMGPEGYADTFRDFGNINYPYSNSNP
jgi:hypothetical protein